MTNNDILRRLRYTFDYSDRQMISIFVLGEAQVTREQLSAFFRKVGHKHYRECHDQILRN